MLIAAIVLASLITAFWVAAPLWRPFRPSASVRPRRSALQLQREKLLGELKELEFDRRMGKIELAEYTPLRAELAARASKVLKRIEAERAEQNPQSAPQIVEAESVNRWELDVEIEILIARARRRLAIAANPNWHCECGREMSDADRFCASCGAPRPNVLIA